jgi:aspartyl-tRNA(Asn)/glutamyl-tRNA(Gln) amidotransferase subunit A
MGPLTRSSRDAAAVLQAIAGFDARDDTSSKRAVPDYMPPPDCSIRGVRVGVPENFFFEKVQPDVGKAAKEMIAVAESLGGRLTPVRVPDMAAVNAAGRVILLSEASALFEKFMDRREKFGDDVLALIDQGRLIRAADYINAQRLRRVLAAEFRQIWNKVDCLLTPTAPNTAPRIGQTTIDVDGAPQEVRVASTRFVRCFNVLGLPALSIPCGLDRGGLPAGLQIVARPFDEAMILRVGAALEDATTFHQLAPPEAAAS